MKSKRECTVLTVCIGCILVAIFMYDYVQGSSQNYEISHEITTPEYRTDAGRAIDAYERLMDRYIDATEKNISKMNDNLKEMSNKISSLELQLAQITESQKRIETALGINQKPQKEETPVDTEQSAE